MQSIHLTAFSFVLLVATAATPPVAAHEFWIEPLEYRVVPGEPITARIKVGQNFEGDNLPWLPDQVVEAGIWDSDRARAFDGMVGDLPAISETAANPGLSVLYYYSRPNSLTHTVFATFETYLHESGQDDLLDVHRQRGLPDIGFIEAFSRCAKALIQVGEDAGRDRLTGMPLEFLAGANPYRDDDRVLPVRLFWLGEPLGNAQVTVFRKNGGTAIAKLRTAADGGVAIPLEAGETYLLSAVKMIPRDDQTAIVWHSYWASLTFRSDRDQTP